MMIMTSYHPARPFIPKLILIPALLFFLMAGSLLTGCRKSQVLRLVTDQPEMLLASELFNSELVQGQVRVQIDYAANPAATLNEVHPPDLLISEDLLGTSQLEKLMTLKEKELFPNDHSEDEDFYTPLMQAGFLKEERKALPLSFNTGIILLHRNSEKLFAHPLFTTPEELHLLSSGFDVSNEGTYSFMGFSPLWDGPFVFDTLLLYGAAFTTDRNFSWNNSALNEALEFLRSWDLERDEGVKNVRNFQEKYLTIPPYRLLQKQKIFFTSSTLTEYGSFSDQVREDIAFRYLYRDGKLSVKNMVSAGINKESSLKQEALTFVRWMVDPESQKRIMKKKGVIRDEKFGFLSGLSTHPSVNLGPLEDSFPFCSIRSIENSHLPLPELQDLSWNNQVDQQLIPWLLKEIEGKNRSSLSESREEWINHYLPSTRIQ